MQHDVSLANFLRTGRLGPLHCGLTPAQVAELLGVPDAWIVNDPATFPAYWCYGSLEISFHSRHSPFGMEFFQIEHAHTLKGRHEPFGKNMRMRLDGLNGRSRPSAFLRSMGPSGATVEFEMPPSGWFDFHIRRGGMVLAFAGEIDEAVAECWGELPERRRIRLLDRHAKIVSIYAHAPSAQTTGEPSRPKATVLPAGEYQVLLAAK